MNNTLISIITPIYNSERYLSNLFNSVISQSYKNFELILIDDGSTDSSCIIIDKFKALDSRIRVIKLSKNSGVAFARSVGLKNANGDLVAFLDADDIWLPKKLEIQSSFMLKNNIKISYTDYRFISDDGHKIGLLVFGPNKIGWHLHHMTRFLGCSTVMINRDLFRSFTFDNWSHRIKAEDFLAWSKFISKYKFAYRCPFDLTRYTLVKGSRSSNGFLAAKSLWFVYRNIENISFPLASFYFLSYILFSSVKRIYAYPRFKI